QFGELSSIETLEYLHRVIDDLFELIQQVALRDRSALGEFGRAITDVGCAADPSHNPLPQVAGQMQNEIADAIQAGSRTLPHLLIGQLTGAMSNPIQSAIQFICRRGANRDGQFVGRHVSSPPAIDFRLGTHSAFITPSCRLTYRKSLSEPIRSEERRVGKE